MSEPVSRRDFIKGVAVVVGGIITAAIGIPTIAYLIDPALKESAKEDWIPVGKFEDVPVGKPTPFSFTRVQVNGWERTATSHGGYVIRKSEDPNDLLILNSRCTHLACTVNWSENDRVFLAPATMPALEFRARCLAVPRHVPWTGILNSVSLLKVFSRFFIRKHRHLCHSERSGRKLPCAAKSLARAKFEMLHFVQQA